MNRIQGRLVTEGDVRLFAIIASMVAQAVRLRQQTQEERELLIQENLRLQSELKEKFRPSNIIGKSKGMQEVYQLIALGTPANGIVFHKQIINAVPIHDGVDLPHSFDGSGKFFSMEEKRERSVKVRLVFIFLKPIVPPK